MQPVYADFTAHPPRLGNGFLAETDGIGPHQVGDHVILNAGESAEVGFDLGEGEQIGQATLGVTALVSKLGPAIGYAPLTVAVNGRSVVERWTIPGGGDLPQDLSFAVPGDWLLPGTRNTIEVRSGEDARSHLWLYRITFEEVFDRGAAARALAADAARESVFTYRTQLAVPGEDGWTDGPELRVYIDRGERSLPAQLSWTRADGSECAISFQSAMDGFSGYLRAADGTNREFQGQLTARAEYDESAPPDHLLRFEAEEGWGGGWHRSAQLCLAVADTGPTPHRLTWRDQRGNSGSISLSPGGDGFLGYYQRYNEGPIGYRGTAVQPPSAAPATVGIESLRHDLEEIGRHAQHAAEHVTELLSGWLKPRR
jgi:hypothetical protein